VRLGWVEAVVSSLGDARVEALPNSIVQLHTHSPSMMTWARGFEWSRSISSDLIQGNCDSSPFDQARTVMRYLRRHRAHCGLASQVFIQRKYWSNPVSKTGKMLPTPICKATSCLSTLNSIKDKVCKRKTWTDSRNLAARPRTKEIKGQAEKTAGQGRNMCKKVVRQAESKFDPERQRHALVIPMTVVIRSS
jgi:hypothetical protein